jgi:hypothetical protein
LENIRDIQISYRILIIWFPDDPVVMVSGRLGNPIDDSSVDREMVQEDFSWSGMPVVYLPGD